MSDAVSVHRRYHAALRDRDFTAIEAMLAPEAAYRSAGIGALAGRAAILEAFGRYFADHPDHTDGDDCLERIAPHVSLAHWWLTATNARTGVAATRRGTERLTLDDRGRIVLVEVDDA